MEIETITDDAKRALIKILNESLQVEYAFILNYPRLIDIIRHYHEFQDEQLCKDLEKLGKDSSRHLGSVGELIVKLGGEPMWEIQVIGRVADVEKVLAQQLEREKLAKSMYQEAKLVAQRNKAKAKVREILGKFIKVKYEEPEDVVDANDVINTFERIITDEGNHIRLVEDSIATLNALMNK